MQVILVACSQDSSVIAWDPHTGLQLGAYKGNSSSANCFCLVGRDYLAAAQRSKDAVLFWAWHKDTALQRSFVVEKLVAIAASPNGAYLAGGGASGTLYIWELATGALVRSWQAHYKAVTVLSFSDCGTILLSGGEDTLVQAWLLTVVLDVEEAASRQQHQQRMPAMHSWSEHTLPVTGLCVGVGGVAALVATASYDRNVKIWRLGDGALLRSVPLTAALICLALDPGEHVLYAGAANGSIFEVSLVGANSRPFDSGGAAPAGTSAAYQQLEEGVVEMSNGDKAVNCLALLRSGDLLVAGSDDGTVHVWDMRSRQQLRQLTTPSNAVVSAIVATTWPAHLPPPGTTAGERRGARRPQPLAALSKYPGGGNLRPWEAAPTVINGGVQPVGVADSLWATLGETPLAVSAADGILASADGASTAVEGPEGGEAAAAARQEAERWRQEASKWQLMYRELHSFVVDKVVRATDT